MDKSTEYRNRIDEIDRQIAALYDERMSVSQGLARRQLEEGTEGLHPGKERQKLNALGKLAGSDENRRDLEELFEQIFSVDRRRRYALMQEKGRVVRLPFAEIGSLHKETARVVYQGAPGSYSEAAMKIFFGPEVDCFAVHSFRDVMIAIEEGAADYGILPIENSTAGIVSESYDLLAEFENYIVGQQTIPIRHCLMAPEGASLDSIRTVYSHAQSLMQSERFLSDYPEWKQVGMQNNAYAAMKVAREGDISQAAIASEYAAAAYGLKILERGVNHANDNSTRFIIVTSQKVFVKDAGRISLCLEALHKSGSLYHLLSHVIYNGLNMVKIESRPIEDRPFEYRFFLDFEGNLRDPAVRNALRGLRDESRSMRVLGNY